MSNFLPKSVRSLIEEFARLPGMGRKSAQRLTMHLLRSPDLRIQSLGQAVLGLKNEVVFCGKCWNIAETSPCMICEDEKRDHGLICVVEDILDVVALEKTGEFQGLYHVLHGALSPIDGVGPEQLKMEALFERVRGDEPVREVILATNPSLEGEATALYIQKHLGEKVNLTRIARGLPMGGDVEYADAITLGRALKGRGGF